MYRYMYMCQLLTLFLQTLSWVDIHAFCICDNMTRYFSIKLEEYPVLLKLCDYVATRPNIKKWLETRPDTHH